MSFWYLAGAAGVAGVLLSTENVSSQKLGEEWAVDVPQFFCKVPPGNRPENELFRLGSDNFAALITVAILLMFISLKYVRFALLKAIGVAIVIFVQTIAIIGFMRHSTIPQVHTICEVLAARTQGTLLTNASDLIVPFLHPLQYLPLQPFTDDLAMRTYAVIYPHLAEFFLTVEPALPYAFLILGFLLEFRPIKNKFWQYLPIIGAIVSFVAMAFAQTSEFNRVDPYDLLLNTILQYAIFYLATFVMLAIVVVLFRLGMRRVSVLSLFLIFSRLQLLGMPQLDFFVTTGLLIFFIALLVTTCDFSPGTFVLYALAAHSMGWKTVEWGLVAMLLDNCVYQFVTYLVDNSERNRSKQRKTKKD